MAYRLFLCGGKRFSGDQKTPLQRKREKTRKIHPLFSRLRSSVMSGLKLKSFEKLFAVFVSSIHFSWIFLSVRCGSHHHNLPPDYLATKSLPARAPASLESDGGKVSRWTSWCESNKAGRASEINPGSTKSCSAGGLRFASEILQKNTLGKLI